MLYGHKNKQDVFKNLIKKDMLFHAYLFFGETQIGKFHFSKHLAYYLEHKKFDILEKSLIDTIFIKHLDDKKTIGIDQIRNIKYFFYQKPLVSNKRLIIINEAYRLTPQAQVGLLKLVEEAPKHIVFIFIIEDERSLLPPLLSRLQKIYFRKLSREKIQKILKEDFNISGKIAHKIAKYSFGRIGRAIDILKNKNKDDESLEFFLNKKIIELFLKNKKENSKLINWLLNKEKDIKRSPLNLKLQQKVIQYKINKNEF